MRAGRAALAAAAVGGAALAVLAEVDDGVARSLRFWRVVLPIYAHYRLVKWRTSDLPDDETSAAYDVLHEEYAPVVEAATLDLRGYYLKLAQLLSTVDHFIPPQYLAWCKRTQDEAPTPLSIDQVKKAVERSLGRPVEAVFSEFDAEPCGSASIGQVHRARLRSNGREVAVKVQGPGIEHKFRSDIGTVMQFLRLFMPQHLKAMEEIEDMFETEFDYVGEAESQARIFSNIMPVFGDRVAVPEVFFEYCTRDVLVSEFFHGPSLVKGAKAQLEAYARSINRPYEEVEREQLELLQSGDHKSIEAESRRMNRYQALLDAKLKADHALTACFNWTLGWLVGSRPFAERVKLLNLADIILLVSKVHAHEIMIDGLVNGDPHPGNILLLEDGRIGLIDYGQVKSLSPEMRRTYAELILALGDEDEARVVSILQGVGFRTKYNNPHIIFRLTQFWHDRNTPDVFEGRNLPDFLDYCEATDPIRDQPADFIVPGRISVILRGLGNFFGFDMRMAHLWRPTALAALARD